MAKNTQELLALLTDSPLQAVDEKGAFHYSMFEDLPGEDAFRIADTLTVKFKEMISSGMIEGAINTFVRTLVEDIELNNELEVIYAMFIIGRMYADLLEAESRQKRLLELLKGLGDIDLPNIGDN